MLIVLISSHRKTIKSTCKLIDANFLISSQRKTIKSTSKLINVKFCSRASKESEVSNMVVIRGL